MAKTRRDVIVETGIELLETGLVARTWGNVSARVDDEHMLITPSGLDYNTMTDDDISLVNMTTGEWAGPRKPSGERGIHKEVYQCFPDVNFVIHTHQTYASAIGLSGFDALDADQEEIEALGGLARAEYAITGTGKLAKNIGLALETGAHTILMPHHGVLICGVDKDEAMQRALLLEEICRRNCSNQIAPEVSSEEKGCGDNILREVQQTLAGAQLVQSPEVLKLCRTENVLKSQLEDMAQMVGPSVSAETEIPRIINTLEKTGAVLVPDIGFIVCAETEDDTEALAILMDKAAKVRLHTIAKNDKAELGTVGSMIEHIVYLKKYSKQKNR